MNKICRKYIGEIKTMFPVKTKKEREYIKNLSLDVEDYCNSENVTSKEALYENYGNPIDVVSEYLSAVGVQYIIKRIRISKYIKAFIIALIIALLAVTSLHCYINYQAYQIAAREEIVITEENIIIEDEALKETAEYRIEEF